MIILLLPKCYQSHTRHCQWANRLDYLQRCRGKPEFHEKYQKAFPSYSINGHIEAADILMENIEEATDQAQTAYHGMIILLTSKDHS